MFKTDRGENPLVLETCESIELEMKVIFNMALNGLIYGLTIRTVDGVIVFGANTRNRGIRTKSRNEGEIAWIRFVFNLNLLPGEYFLSLGIAQDDDTVDNRAIDRRYDLVHFTVQGALNDLGFDIFDISCTFHQGAAAADDDTLKLR